MGETVGSSEGELLVGNTVGAVGKIEGMFEGSYVGFSEGAAVGTSVG